MLFVQPSSDVAKTGRSVGKWDGPLDSVVREEAIYVKDLVGYVKKRYHWMVSSRPGFDLKG